MMQDSDLIAIQRKRRREKRCLRCGVQTPRAALCLACRAAWRYCPRCEAVYPAEQASQRRAADGRATAYCLPCGNIIRNGEKTPRAEYIAQRRRTRDVRIAQALRLYRRGVSYAEMAQQLGVTKGALSGLIGYARVCGAWPATLHRRLATKRGPQ